MEVSDLLSKQSDPTPCAQAGSSSLLLLTPITRDMNFLHTICSSLLR